MAGKRLNDTKAISGMKPVSNLGESVNIDIRPIDNGYIKRETKCSDVGGYTSKETFHSEKPSLDPMGKNGNNMMKSAVDFLKK